MRMRMRMRMHPGIVRVCILAMCEEHHVQGRVLARQLACPADIATLLIHLQQRTDGCHPRTQLLQHCAHKRRPPIIPRVCVAPAALPKFAIPTASAKVKLGDKPARDMQRNFRGCYGDYCMCISLVPTT